ncbi:uncharacterized protein UTRI_05238 [Ustilago trichophora]|uniref:Shelterin complex subunit TPP1/Est3 domain-containing protein n=1 Tax=Ustilago trichophora TaxID=86804 RepID=A0A5C3EM98_9BASI|nr:uncharacterized protein UTRI_05238 [Ustilago trichophora]
MSESLKSWLFIHTSSSAILSLENNYDLSDLPYVRGNRVQLLRFLTFRPPASPNSHNTDVWALVGDRTHCIAARFAREQVNRFHKDHNLTFTSLKGALLTLTHVRTSVSRVQVDHTSHGAGGIGGEGRPYRQGQYAVILDVKGWQVVSSISEPVWFAGVKVVTSTNGFPMGEEERGREMLRWLKKWVRYKCLLRRAKVEQRQREKQREKLQAANVGEGGDESASTTLPTPAQRIGKRKALLVLSSSQVQNTQPLQPSMPAQQAAEKTASQDSESLPSTTSRSMGPSSSSAAVAMAALWQDFDLDFIAVNDDHVDAIDVPGQWDQAVLRPSTEPATPAVPVVAQATQESPQTASIPAQEEFQSQTQSQTQTQTQSDLDPYESGLSDYERNTRLARYRFRHPPNPPFPSSSPINPNETSAQKIDRHRERLHPTFEPWKARRLELDLSTSHSAYIAHLDQEATRIAEAYEADEIFKAACERSSSEEREREEAAVSRRRGNVREARSKRIAGREEREEEGVGIGRFKRGKDVVQGLQGQVRQVEMDIVNETASAAVLHGEKDIPSQMSTSSGSPTAPAKTSTSIQHKNTTSNAPDKPWNDAQSTINQHLSESELPPSATTHDIPPQAPLQKHPKFKPSSIPSSPSASSTTSKRSRESKKRKRNQNALAAL